jgi:hypothetical protein
LKAFGRAVPWLLLLVAIADWIGLKRGTLTHPPWILALLVGAVIVSLLWRLLVVPWTIRAGRRKAGPAIGECLLITGVLMALGAGTANWMLGLQGFVVLNEGDAVPLHGGSHLQQFDGGPLARIEEMHVALALDELILQPVGPGLFFPESHLRVLRDASQPEKVVVSPRASGFAGPLRFHQGAFGFAPRIVILREEQEVFDRVVPFTTRREGPAGLSFAGTFTIERERLAVEGSVDLDSLDAGMRGHATLVLVVTRDGAPIGRGSLMPGHFADLEHGYRIGFAGLKKWSEIDISRRTYGGAVLAGAALALGGALFWPVAAWRSR